MKSDFLQYLPCEAHDLEGPNVEIPIQKSRRDDLETNLWSILNPQNWYKQVPTSLPNRPKSCYLPPPVHPAAPMDLQGGPRVPKWSPKVLHRCQNGILESQKGGTKLSKWQPREDTKSSEIMFHTISSPSCCSHGDSQGCSEVPK